MKGMARVHYVISDELHRRIKVIAAKRDMTLRQAVIEALERYADQQEQDERERRPKREP